MDHQTSSKLSNDMFQPVKTNASDAEKIAGPSLSYWQDAWRRFRKNKLAMFGIIVILVLTFMALFGKDISGYSYFTNHLANANKPPSAKHWFGTDAHGRDMFTRNWLGARISLYIGVVAALLDIVIGMIWGSIAGYIGGKVDEVMMRIADILMGVPYLLVVVLLSVVLNPGLTSIIIAMVLTGWINMARIVRGQVLSLKSEEYVMAARSLGSSTGRVLFKHLIPNTLGPILITLTLTIPTAIFTEAFLSYLGIGVPAPLASWGTMTSEGVPAMAYYPWELFFPAFFISLTMLAFNVIGDGLRDSLDPKERK